MARRRNDLAAAKQRRQKKIAIAGAVLLAVVLAVQAPRMMKMLDSGAEQSAPAPQGQTETDRSSTNAASEATTEPRASTAPVAELVDSQASPAPDEGDLESFERFSSKDPFVPQVAAAPPTATASATASPATGGESSSGSSASGASTVSTATGGPAGTEAGEPTSAVISVNGTRETVSVGDTFPEAEPTFRLVSLSAASAKIGIAGGTFTSGTKAITLKEGKTLKLMNTADGTRYELRLISVA